MTPRTSLARRLGPVLLAAVVAVTSLGLDAAHPTGSVVRSYVVDDGGAVVKLVIPSGEPGAGTYLPTWSGHGDALALWRLADDGSGTLTLANSYTYGTWERPRPRPTTGAPISASASSTSASSTSRASRLPRGLRGAPIG